jgi:hypothetical protein
MEDNNKPNLISGSFSPTSLSGTSFTLGNFHYVSKPNEKIIANVSGQNLNVSGEVRELDIKTLDKSPPHITINVTNVNYQSFNPTLTNQNIFESYSIENILTIVNNQQNISTEDK